MNLLNYSLKSIGIMGFKAAKINTLNNIIISDRIRFFAATAETAVQKITVRSIQKGRKKFNYDGATWLLLVIPASAFGLGTWQVFRKFEKDKINEEFLRVINQPPIELPKDLNELKNLEYRQVRVRGRFDHSKELYFGPRPKIDNDVDKLTLSLLSVSNAGYLVVTPFKLSDRDLTILVNRGWVLPKEKSPAARPKGQITEEVELIGVVRLHENRKPMGVKNVPEKNIWLHRDLNQMSLATGAAPVFLDAHKSSTVPGGPIGGQTIVELKNDHLSYICTWYGLSIASGYLWYLRHFPKIPIVV